MTESVASRMSIQPVDSEAARDVGRDEVVRMYRRYGELSWDGPEAATAASPSTATAPATPGKPQRPARAPGTPLERPRGGGDRLPTIRLHGVRLHAVTQARCVEYILDEIDVGRGGIVVTPNLDHLRRCVRD